MRQFRFIPRWLHIRGDQNEVAFLEERDRQLEDYLDELATLASSGGGGGGAGSLLAANNLSDVASVATSRANLGLGTAAVKNVPATGDAATTEVVQGTDTRLTNSRTPTAHAATHGSAGSDPLTVTTAMIAASAVTGTELADNAVTVNKIFIQSVVNAKLANMANGTIKGRATAGAGVPEDLTGTQTTALLDVFGSATKGLAPASGGGTTNFLRADGTWAAPTAADTAVIVASEALAAGAYVNVFSSGGLFRVRNANATSVGLEAHGFVLAAVAINGNATVFFEGANTGVTGQTPGVVYLSTTAGGGTTTPPSAAGNVVQRIGYAVSATSVNFQSLNPVVLA